jgi:hypothetical protein
MKHIYEIIFFFKKSAYILSILCFSHLGFAQKKDNNNSAISPTNPVVVSAKNDRIRRQIIADWDDEINFPRAINNGINRRLLVSNSDRIKFRKDNQTLGIFYIPKEKLMELLYNDDTTQGFNLFFTKFNNEIVLVKADSSFNNIGDKFVYLNTTEKPASISTPSIKNQALSEIRRGYKYQTKSYFIGRQCIMRNFTDSKGNFINESVGVRMDVITNKAKQYSIIFTLINNDKSTTYLGLATTELSQRVVLLGGGASSRPCPTHCPEE